MNRFTADYSSSIGSEPAQTPPRSKGLFFDEPDVPSTTPVVPPPSTVFGSSRFGTGGNKPLFQRSSPPKTNQSSASQRPTVQSRQNGLSIKPKSKLGQTSFNDSIDSGWLDDTQDDLGADDNFDDEMEQEPSFVSRGNATSLMRFSTNSPRRSMARSMRRQPERNPSRLPNAGRPDFVPGLSRDLAARAKPPSAEPDEDLVLDTEVILQQLYDEAHNSMTDETDESVVDSKAHELVSLWQRYTDARGKDEPDVAIGPPTTASAFDKANYISSLLLSLRSTQYNTRGDPVPIPKVILEWLERHHVSYETLYRNVTRNPTNVTASELFWDAILCLTLRGKLSDVMKLLQEADFKYAVTSLDDGAEEPGYRGSQLQTIQSVVYRARQILNASPIASGNWDTSVEEWEVYRSNVQTELETIVQLVAEPPEDDDQSGYRPQMDLLGRQSQTSRSLPLSIYQGIRTMFSILLGSTEEIIAQSQDWLEAACALTVWWDGSSDQKIAKWNADVSRASSRGPVPDTADLYLGRLREAFLCVTDPESKGRFSINTLSPVEIGVGCVLQGAIEGVISILRTQSLCLTTAVVEVGSAAGWLDDGSSAPAGLNSTDLMVLSFGGGREDVNKDEILQEYAVSLFARNDLKSMEGESIEGWELSLGVLRRMDDTEMMHECVADLLDQLDVTEQWRAEKVINLCFDLGLAGEARNISERFGDHLVNSTTSYGLALLCYARSHSSHKIQQLTDLLISYCFVQSRAYPAEEDIDAGLHSLVDTPKAAFADIAELDPEAAAHLQFYMVGYACIRRFYSLRDQSSQVKLGPIARKRAAAKTLIAAINSAADCIYGGLYDESRKSAIQVDGLLTLLGEATALLSSKDEGGVYASDQLYALLAAIEDLETVSERVYAATDECLQASMRNFAGSAPPSPREMLKKSMSSGTNSNFSFSMMGSEMLGRSGESGHSGGKSVGSAVLVKGNDKGDETRDWDWRARFKGVEMEGVGRDVLRVLRRGIAEELSERALEES